MTVQIPGGYARNFLLHLNLGYYVPRNNFSKPILPKDWDRLKPEFLPPPQYIFPKSIGLPDFGIPQSSIPHSSSPSSPSSSSSSSLSSASTRSKTSTTPNLIPSSPIPSSPSTQFLSSPFKDSSLEGNLTSTPPPISSSSTFIKKSPPITSYQRRRFILEMHRLENPWLSNYENHYPEETLNGKIGDNKKGSSFPEESTTEKFNSSPSENFSFNKLNWNQESVQSLFKSLPILHFDRYRDLEVEAGFWKSMTGRVQSVVFGDSSSQKLYSKLGSKSAGSCLNSPVTCQDLAEALVAQTQVPLKFFQVQKFDSISQPGNYKINIAVRDPSGNAQLYDTEVEIEVRLLT